LYGVIHELEALGLQLLEMNLCANRPNDAMPDRPDHDEAGQARNPTEGGGAA
jgi:hypothetical protein